MSFTELYTEKYISRNGQMFASPIYNPPSKDHSHTFFELSFVRKGCNTNVINGIRIPFARGTCVLLRPNDHHYFDDKMYPNPNMYEHIDIYVYPKDFINCCNAINSDLYQEILSQKMPIAFNVSESFLNSINNKIDFLINNQSSELAYTIQKIITIELLSAYYEDKKLINHNYPEWLNNLMNDLNSIDTIKLKIKDLSYKYGYSSEHLSREFVKYTGINLINYITSQRIKFSLPLILGNKLQMIDIALILGYQKQSTFSSNFKTIMKCSPKQYQLINNKRDLN